jgi:predicted Zn-dependent peptidase
VRFEQTRLDNGLTIIAEVNPAAASMAVGFFVRTGSRDETPETSGVSHFLEHMAFKGTARRSALDVNREFDEMGAVNNAFTSEENTVYFGAVLPEHQTRLLGLLADILRPALRAEDFDIEKEVILEEIARYQDDPAFRLYEKLMAEYFQGHPLGREVLGTAESVAALRRDDMQAYFERRYSPGNVVLVGVGKLDFAALADQADKVCSHWQGPQAPRQTPPAPGRTGQRVVTDAKLAREHVGLMSAAPPVQDADRYAAQLLATVMGDATGSRLFYALVDPAVADEASMAYDAMDRTGAFVTLLCASPDRAAEAVRIARDELRRFQDDGPTEAELQAAKNKIASGATLKGELPMGRLSAVGFDWVYRREYVPLPEQIEALFAVGRQDVLSVARTYDLTAAVTLALGPRETL